MTPIDEGPSRAQERLRAYLGDAMAGADSPLNAADLLCGACVEVLDVDGASISLLYDGATRGTFGASSPMSRELDELQFTFGEGPCMDAVRDEAPVLVPDLGAAGEQRWPALRPALLDTGVRAVFALPVTVASSCVGALDLVRHRSGSLPWETLAGGLLAAQLAAVPLLDLMTAPVDWERVGQSRDGWEQLASLERVEVYQATGMVMAALEVGPAEALVRLRAQAFARGTTASTLSWDVIERRVPLNTDDWRDLRDGSRP